MGSVEAGGGKGEGEAGGSGGLDDGAGGCFGIGAVELGAAGNDHLGGVDVGLAETGGVVALALGVEVGGEAVAPAERVPVVNMLGKDDDVSGGDGLVVVKAGKQGVCRRTTGTALGGEKLNEDGGARGGLGDGGGGGGC